jgi:hypothetical protein
MLIPILAVALGGFGVVKVIQASNQQSTAASTLLTTPAAGHVPAAPASAAHAPGSPPKRRHKGSIADMRGRDPFGRLIPVPTDPVDTQIIK